MTRRHGSHWSEVAPDRIHARVAAPSGSMPSGDVVLVHGLGVSSRYMVPLLERLGADVRCWAPDLPGHGRSPGPVRRLRLRELVEVLDRWLDLTGVREPVLVANSYGCQVVVELARRRAGIRSLVLVGAVTDVARRSAIQQVTRLAMDQLHEPAHLVAMQSLEYLRTGPGRTIGEFRDSRAHDLLDAVADVRCPVTLVRGEQDPISPRDWNERLLEHAGPAARLVEVPGLGHCVHYTAPDEVARIALGTPPPPAAEPS